MSTSPDHTEQYLARALARARKLAIDNGNYPAQGSVRVRQFAQWDKSQTIAENGHHGGQKEAAAENNWIDDKPAAGQQARSHWQAPPAVPAPKLGRGWSKYDPKPLGVVISAVAQREGWNRMLSVAQVAAQWSQIVGPAVAQHCQVESFDEKVLYVRTSSTAWANQLQLLLPRIEKNIASRLGSAVVKQVIIRGPAAPSWKKGPWSVPGRGPRDTYG